MKLKKSVANVRVLAVEALSKVLAGSTLTTELPLIFQLLPENAQSKPFLQALLYGVCRKFFYLKALANLLIKKPLKEKDQAIYLLILLGLYQLKWMRSPSYAVVTQTVDACSAFKKDWAKGFVNAVLRHFLRQEKALEAQLVQDESALYCHPKWYIDKIKSAYLKQWQAILRENNREPPFALRVNQRKLSRADYLHQTGSELVTVLPTEEVADGSKAYPIPFTETGLIMTPALEVAALPGFAQGEVSVQDGAAQLASPLLELSKGLRVLDACAAPGGKLCHILEAEPNLAFRLAIEKDRRRMTLIQENLQRLALDATCLQADATQIETWWDGTPFDRILIDAPCSASGVIRRHPDSLLVKKNADLARLTQQQYSLLTALWQTLAPQGLLVYATCSIFPEENEEQMAAFLSTHEDAEIVPIETPFGELVKYGRQILPGMHNMDGFYYARLRKR